MSRRCSVALALAWLWPCLAAAGGAQPEWRAGDPLRVRNVSPVAHLFGLPRPTGGMTAPGTTEVAVLVEHANNFTAAADGATAAVFDGSTTVTSLTLRGGLDGGWEWGLEVPYVSHGGGFTDGFIEGFHDLFGMPDGDRDAVPRDRIDYRVTYRGEELVRITDTAHHLGDLRAWAGRRLHQGPGRQAVLRAMIELPTGRVDDLSGSDGTDLALWLELVDGRWLEGLATTVTLAAGVTVPGGGGFMSDRQRDAVVSAHLGLHHALTPAVTLRAQLDGHSDIIDGGVTPLAEGAVLGTLGGSIRLSTAMRLDLGLVEDLTTEHAPDVVFVVSLGARF